MIAGDFFVEVSDAFQIVKFRRPAFAGESAGDVQRAEIVTEHVPPHRPGRGQE